MKIAVALLSLLVFAAGAQAQAKKYKTLNELEASIDKDKLAALEAFVKDKAGKDEAELKSAEAMIPALKVSIAMKGTDGAGLKDAHAKFITGLTDSEIEDIQKGVDTTRGVSDRMVEINDVAGAKAVWTALDTKFGAHPQAGVQIKKLVENQVGELDLIGAAPKAFTVKDLEDKELSIESFKGKVVLIDFWATWCGPCVRELPNVIEAYKKYHDKGFEIVGVSLDGEDKGVLTKFLEGHPDMKWRQFYDGKKWKNEVAVLYGVQSIPATYLIDQEGKIYRMGLRGKALDKAIEKLLAKSPAKKG